MLSDTHEFLTVCLYYAHKQNNTVLLHRTSDTQYERMDIYS